MVHEFLGINNKNISKVTKRKRPSILQFYKYHKGEHIKKSLKTKEVEEVFSTISLIQEIRNFFSLLISNLDSH